MKSRGILTKEFSTPPVLFYFFKKEIWGIPWWSNGQDSVFSLSGPQVPSLVGVTKILQAIGILGVAKRKKKKNLKQTLQNTIGQSQIVRVLQVFIYALSLKYERTQKHTTLQYKKFSITTTHVITNNYVLLYKSIRLSGKYPQTFRKCLQSIYWK